MNICYNHKGFFHYISLLMIIWGYVVMISRRWLSLLLALLLLLPAAALATSPNVVRNARTDTAYTSLADAVSAASAGDTLELLADVTMDDHLSIPSKARLTLDLGDNTLNLGNYSIKMDAPDAALTLQAAGGRISGSGAPCFDISAGTLNILSGTYQSKGAVISTVEGVITVSGGTLAGGTGSSGNLRTIYSYGASKIRLENNAAVTNANDACVSLYGGDLTVSGNASLSGVYGVALFNHDKANTSTSIHSSVTMTGGTVRATKYFALSGNNRLSAQSNVVITGGSLSSPPDCTAIYWPMEGTLTIGGTASVTGGTAIEAKMGTITIKDQAVITGTGAWNEDEPENGGSSPEGSALLLSTQLYGGNEGQCIDSPKLTVQLSGGRLVSGKGNAVTVFNTGKNGGPADVTVSGAHLEGGRTILKVISPEKVVPDSSFDSKGNFTTESDKTAVTVTGGAVAATQGDGNSVVFYGSLGQALENARTHVYVLSDDGLTLKTLSNPDIKLTVAPGVQLRAASGKDGYTLVQTRNANGSVTYELSDSDQVGKLMAPSVTASLSGGKLTATASSTTQGATFTYQWYRDGAPIPGATAATFSPTQKGSYSVEVQASVQRSGMFILSPVGRSAAVAFDPAPAPTATPQPATATPPKTGDSTPLALYALLALLALATLTALTTARRRHG